MNAQNETNEMNMIVNEAVAIANPDEITDAQLADYDYDGESENAMVKIINIELFMEHYIENCQDFMLPYNWNNKSNEAEEYNETPFSDLMEMIDELKECSWGGRVIDRMRKQVSGEKPKVRLTDRQKEESDDYLLCDCCIEFINKKYYRTEHIQTEKHKSAEITMNVRRTNDKEKKIKADFIYHTKKVNDGMDRVFANLKLKVAELVEEKIEDMEVTYVVKTWDKGGEYGGLFEVNGEKYWDCLIDANEKYGWAVDCDEFGAVELVMIDPTKNEDRETIIEEWKV